MFFPSRDSKGWAGIRDGAVGFRRMFDTYQREDMMMGGIPRDTNPLWSVFVAAYLLSLHETHPGVGAPERADPFLTELVEWQLRWADQGMPNFELTSSLASKFILTEVETLRMDTLRFPFSAFLLHVPMDLGLTIDTERGPVPARWVLVNWTHTVSEDRVLDEADRFSGLLATVGVNKLTPRFVQTAFDEVKADLLKQEGGRLPRRLMVRLLGEGDIGVFFGSSDDKALDCRVGEWLRLTPEGAARAGELSEKHHYGQMFTVQDVRCLRLAWRLVVNTLLYLEAKPGLLPAPRRASYPPGEKVRTRLVVLGREVKVAPNLLQAARHHVKGHAARAAWKVLVRSVVRGHWKQQPHGPKGAERVRKWIEPYERGPEDGPRLVERKYRVE